MNRRHFLSWVGVGTLAASLPVAIAACNPEDPNADAEPSDIGSDTAETTVDEDAGTGSTDDATVSDNNFVSIGTVAELDQQGFLASEDLPGGPVIIIRDPEQPSSLIALDSRCPHRGCAVEWQSAEGQFLCPCHQSAFTPDGSVTSGPATTALDPLEVTIEGEQVLVKTA
jgi:cytochrome b6-f complex iron-sulfur subunit